MSYKSSYNPYTCFRFNWERALTLTLKKNAGLITVGRMRSHWCIFSLKAKMILIHIIIFTTTPRSATSVTIC